MDINNKFTHEQIVYLKTDSEQMPRMIKSFQVYKSKIVYQLVCGVTDSWHDDFEISTESNKQKVNGFK